MYFPKLVKHEETAIFISSRRIYTQYSTNSPVFIVNCYAVPLLQVENLAIQLDKKLNIFRDSNLGREPVAISTRITSLLRPKALQLMPYKRGWEEALLLMIPWLGFIISLFLLISAVLLARAQGNKRKRLVFSFPAWFYYLSSLITFYPFVLTYLDKARWIVWFVPGVFLLLVALNLLVTKLRNTQVTQYNQMIVEMIEHAKFKKSDDLKQV